MKLLILLGLLLLSSCAATRVLVKDCHDAGPNVENCELIQKL